MMFYLVILLGPPLVATLIALLGEEGQWAKIGGGSTRDLRHAVQQAARGATRGEAVKLRHRDAVRQALMNRLGLRRDEADFMIRIAEREYGFAEPPEGEAPEVTLRLLATMEYVKETLAELDAEAAMLPKGEES